ALNGTTSAYAAAGVATFPNLSTGVAGAGFRLTASLTGLTGATSNAFNVTPGPAVQVAFTVQPMNTTAGAAIAPAVQVSIEDIYGNLVPTANNAVSIAI